MPTPDLGKLEDVPARVIWGQFGFTHWLADNLNLLGDVLGIHLTLTDRWFRAVSLGRYRVNILAEDIKGEKVAIEDRTGWTDYSHLGQSVKYAAEHDAKHVVLVARHFDAEHRLALDWLNRMASDKVWFFGVELRAVKIGDSPPAPDFRVIAAPEEWWRKFPDALALPTRYRDFFQPLIDDLNREGITENAEEARGDYETCFHSGLENVFYLAGFQDTLSDTAEVCCYFQ